MSYLGETIVDVKDTDFKNYKAADWAMWFIESYGQIDGTQHKQWVIDSVTRILKGTKVIVSMAKWTDGQTEYRIILDKPSTKYLKWVKEYKTDENGDEAYGYEAGVAP